MLIPFGVFCLQSLFFVSSQEHLHICNGKIKPHFDSDIQENCSLSCGIYIQHYILPLGIEEVALCVKDEFTPLLCQRDADCHQRYRRSYCKKIRCLCEEDNGRSFPKSPVDFLDICVVPSNRLHPNMPLVAFPWKTVLTVFGSLGVIVIIFMGFRWLYPLMRTFHDSNRHRPTNEHSASSEGNSMLPLYSDISQERLCNRSILHGNSDKPPSYETLVHLLDLPPSYEETESIQNRNHLLSEENQSQRREANSSPAEESIQNGTETNIQLQNNK